MNPKKELINSYANLLLDHGVSKSEAKKEARSMFEKAQEKAWAIPECKIANDIWCTGMGDYLLSVEEKDPEIKSLLDTIRAEGATDQDIREYRNVPPVKRAMSDQLELMKRRALFTRFFGEGMDPEEALNKALKFIPVYGDPGDTSHASGDDRPLPGDLKNRVTRYIIEEGGSDPASLNSSVSGHSSMNALIREEINAGRL